MKKSKQQKIWKEKELKELLIHHPRKYRMLQPEIARAYQEGRIIKTKKAKVNKIKRKNRQIIKHWKNPSHNALIVKNIELKKANAELEHRIQYIQARRYSGELGMCYNMISKIQDNLVKLQTKRTVTLTINVPKRPPWYKFWQPDTIETVTETHAI